VTAYLGPAGNLVAFKCPSDEQIERADSVSLSRTLGGLQKAQYGRRAPRAWQVGIGTATPAELGQLMGLLQGLYGPPPWVYVGPWAQVTNLLTPAASMLLPGAWTGTGVEGGPVTLEGGARPSYSVVSDTGATLSLPAVPVIPGIPVTGSFYAVGNPQFTVALDFRNAAGAGIGAAASNNTALAGGALSRRSVTGMPPAGAVDVVLRATGALRAAQPAVTWTPDMAEWSVGGGAPKVVARGLSQAVQLAVRDQAFLRRSSASFVLEEVGNA
jgi:hypothetical protein